MNAIKFNIDKRPSSSKLLPALKATLAKLGVEARPSKGGSGIHLYLPHVTR